MIYRYPTNRIEMDAAGQVEKRHQESLHVILKNHPPKAVSQKDIYAEQA